MLISLTLRIDSKKEVFTSIGAACLARVTIKHERRFIDVKEKTTYDSHGKNDELQDLSSRAFL